MSNIEQFGQDPTIFQKKESYFYDLTQHFLYDLSYTLNPLFREGVVMREQLKEDLGFIHSTYGLQLKMGRQTELDASTIKIPSKLTLIEAVPAVHAIREEIAKYPTEYIQYCDIARFRLVRNLIDLEDDVNPEAAGMAIEDDKHIYLALEKNDIDYLRKTFHHEVFHRGDQRMLEQANRAPLPYRHSSELKTKFFDRGWANINPQGEFTYLYDDYKLQNGESSFDKVKGFARRYGKKDEMEDRATIAEYLMTDPQMLFNRATNDNVLRKKVNRIIQIFSARSNGIMNLDYFQALAQQ